MVLLQLGLKPTVDVIVGGGGQVGGIERPFHHPLNHVPNRILPRPTMQHFLEGIPNSQRDVSGISEEEEEGVAFLEGVEMVPLCALLGYKFEVVKIEIRMMAEVLHLEGRYYAAKREFWLGPSVSSLLVVDEGILGC